MRHTIAICTAHHHGRLYGTLRALRNALAPRHAGATEILAVNNGPAEDSEPIGAMLQEVFRGSPLLVRVLHEPVVGVARARNLALAEAAGEVLTFVDDDVHPCGPEWQESILGTFAAHHRVGLLGGPIACVVPPAIEPEPWWRSMQTDGLLSCNSQTVSGPCDHRLVWSANGSYRRCAVQGLSFPEEVGWRSGCRVWFAGEDTWFNRLLVARGWTAWYEPLAAVEHHIDAARFTPRWLLHRAVIHGRSHSLFRCAEGETLTALRFKACGGLLAGLLGVAVAAVRRRGAEAFARCLDVAARLGTITVPHGEIERVAAALRRDAAAVSSSPVSTPGGGGTAW